MKTFLTASCLTLALILAPLGALQAQTTGLTITGQGEASGAPDMAIVAMSVSEQDKTAADAMRGASASMRLIFDRLDQFGLAEWDRQTSNLTLDPVWSNRASGQGEAAITGYVARNQVTIRLRNLDKLGALLDAVLEDGANGFGGVQFAVTEPQPLIDAARRAAVQDAMRTATLLADAAGVPLGPIRSISMGGRRDPGLPMARMEMASDAGVPVAAGEVSYTAQVTLVFELGD